MEEKLTSNPLGTVPVNRLLRQFAVPSVIAMLVSNLYNIVDQFFIGRAIGELGNAATNIAFPLTISCISIALMFGIGGSAAFNLSMGRKEPEQAAFYIGSSVTAMMAGGLLLCLTAQIFLHPLLAFFGAPAEVMPYAETYTRITALGFPFLILSSGGGHLVRADGSPRFIMYCNLTGAVINTVLDALFIFVFHWGMAGAAIATIIGQIAAGSLVINYLRGFRTIPLSRSLFRPRGSYVKKIASLGMGPCSNQLAMMIVQIVLNNSLAYYGAHSVYGQAVPLACAGIIMKVSQLFFSFTIGISQGLQPIASYNYGAENYGRVKQAYLKALSYALVVSAIAFTLFQLFPRQIIGIFGEGSPEYYDFAEKFFRIFLLFTLFNVIQPITGNLFTSIGKPVKGMFISLTRQIIFFLPLVILLPRAFGIDGILYAGPASDCIAVIIAILMATSELKQEKYRKR